MEPVHFQNFGVTLRQLQYIVAVADCDGFRVAAERCAVSQPALSSQVAHVEAVLDVQIFERDRRRVLVTERGRRIVEAARRVLHASADLLEVATRTADPLSGAVRIGVIPTVAPYLLPLLTIALRRSFPRLTLLWIEGKTSEIRRQLEIGDLDGAVVALEADLGDIESAPIAFDPFVVAVARHQGEETGLSGSQARLRLDELLVSDLLLLDEGHCLRDQTLHICGRVGVSASAYGATSLTTLVQLVASGVGYTLLPELALATENRYGSLHVRRFYEPSPGRTLAMVWRRGSAAEQTLLPITQLIVDTLSKNRGG